MHLNRYSAVLFDLDGVITPTAQIHMKAWSNMFNSYLSQLSNQSPYTDGDYFNYVDGKPRYEGVRDFLASRNIKLAAGNNNDSIEENTICGLGNRKNHYFKQIIATEGIKPYSGSLSLVKALKQRGFKLAIVSSSKNAVDILAAANILELFDVIVDGNVASDKKLSGKPAPDTYSYAAKILEVTNQQSIVVEDALVGVKAGSAGNFGLVIGVDRGVGHISLLANGADLVVSDLAEVI